MCLELCTRGGLWVDAVFDTVNTVLQMCMKQFYKTVCFSKLQNAWNLQEGANDLYEILKQPNLW